VNTERNEDGFGTVKARDQVPTRPTLTAAVRQRRTDRAFFIRLAGAIQQNERAVERLKQ
jgi:hypothetical protein